MGPGDFEEQPFRESFQDPPVDLPIVEPDRLSRVYVPERIGEGARDPGGMDDGPAIIRDGRPPLFRSPRQQESIPLFQDQGLLKTRRIADEPGSALSACGV